MREDDGWAALLLAGGSMAEEGTLLAGTAALLASALSPVGRRSRMAPLSSEGAGWCAARVTKACAAKHPQHCAMKVVQSLSMVTRSWMTLLSSDGDGW